MKSVTFSDIERVQAWSRTLPALPSFNRLSTITLLLGLGLPALMMVFHLIDPTAPLGYIVLPVLLGGLLPVTQALTGRFEVNTRFDACHMVLTLDEALDKLGYEAAECAPGTVRYHARVTGWQDKDITVTVRAHALEVTGPVPALRALRRQIAC